MKFNERGEELPDPTPVEVPANLRRAESTTEMIQRLIQAEVSRVAQSVGGESFEESLDFDVPDEDPDLAETDYTLMGLEIPRGTLPDADSRPDGTAVRAPTRGGDREEGPDGDRDDSEVQSRGSEDDSRGERRFDGARAGQRERSPRASAEVDTPRRSRRTPEPPASE